MADRIEFSRDLADEPRAVLPEALPALVGSLKGDEDEPLGEPMSVQEAAELIGCSVWTLRHRLLRQGLPHFRVSGTKKLIFYRKQVVAWILEKQKEGR
jgi:excisionase family DNA binding protein